MMSFLYLLFLEFLHIVKENNDMFGVLGEFLSHKHVLFVQKYSSENLTLIDLTLNLTSVKTSGWMTS